MSRTTIEVEGVEFDVEFTYDNGMPYEPPSMDGPGGEEVPPYYIVLAVNGETCDGKWCTTVTDDAGNVIDVDEESIELALAQADPDTIMGLW